MKKILAPLFVLVLPALVPAYPRQNVQPALFLPTLLNLNDEGSGPTKSDVTVRTAGRRSNSRARNEVEPGDQNPANVGEAGFQQLADEWKNAYNSKDATRVAALYAEDADYISSHVAGLVAHGREKIRANFQAGIDAGGHVDAVRIITSSFSCNLAYLVCIYEATNSGQKVSGRNLIVSKKVRGKWLIVSHVTVVAE